MGCDMKTAQANLILAALQEGRALSPIEALSEFGCFRLAARIHDLRNQGHKIMGERVTKDDKTFQVYFMRAKGQMEIWQQ